MQQIRIGFICAYEKFSQNDAFTREYFTIVNPILKIIQ